MKKIFTFCYIGIMVYALNAQVQINEVMTWNTLTEIKAGYEGYPDWIELYNPREEVVSIGGWYMTDDPAEPFKWRIPEGYTIEEEGYALILADGFAHGLHANFELKSEGEWLGLFDPDGKLLDSLTIPTLLQNISYGRLPEEAHWRFFEMPTALETNDEQAYMGICKSPEANIPGGFFQTNLSISLQSPQSQSLIYYSLDGSVPTTESFRYNSPIAFTKTSVLRARCFRDGYLPSAPLTYTYLIRENFHDLPVISIQTNPENFWSNTSGIYVTGTNGIKGNGPASDPPRNWNQDWERPIHFEFFESDGSPAVRQDLGIKIFGGWSRSNPQKSLALFARKEYGNRYIEYPFFEEKPFLRYRSLVLRNSGNDWSASGGSMLRDALHHGIIADKLDVDHQAYLPTVVYLNGEYWGIHNMREKMNEKYLAQNHHIDPDLVDMLQWQSTVIEGTNAYYLDLLNFIEFQSLLVPGNYSLVGQEMDIHSFMDYQMSQIYINNQDWPGNNIKCWRAYGPNQQWRWLYYDTDFGFGIWNFQASDNTVSFALDPYGPGWPNPPWSTFLLRRYIQNPSFVEQFNQRFVYHLNHTFSPLEVVQVLDSLAAGIEGEIPRHQNRWGNQSASAWFSEIHGMRGFAGSRAFHVRSHLRGRFNLGPEIQVYLQADSSQGNILENHWSLSPLDSGIYFRELPIPLEALPRPGFRFQAWRLSPVDSGAIQYHYANPIQLSVDQDMHIEALFTPRSLLISEVYPAMKAVDSVRFIELYNAGTTGISLANVHLEGSVEATFPHAIHLSPGAFALVVSDLNTYSGLGIPLTLGDFSNLDSSALQLSLYDAGGELLDSLSLAAEPDTVFQSFRSYTLAHPDYVEWKASDSLAQSPGTANWYSRVAGLGFNELMSQNQDGIQNEIGERADWLEFYNASDRDLNLGGLFISDDKSDLKKWQIPKNYPGKTTLAPHQHLRFWADNAPELGPLHVGFKLNANGESLWLSEETGLIVDSLTYPALGPDQSYGHFPDGADSLMTFLTEASSPGGRNREENTAPYFLGFPPDTLMAALTRFTHQIRSVDAEQDDIFLECLVRPEWLEFNNAGKGFGILNGYPSLWDIGEHLVVLKISDGYQNSVNYLKFLIIVTDPLEAEVQNGPPLNSLLYPNPTRDQLTYLINAEKNWTGKVRIFDLAGRTVWETELVAEKALPRWTWSVKGLPKGLYLVEISDTQSDWTEIHKLIRN